MSQLNSQSNQATSPVDIEEGTKDEGKSDGVVRFSVSVPSELAREFDDMLQQKGYSNRSLAVSDMIRSELLEYRQGAAGEVVGTITLHFDHHKPRLQSLLTDVQHDHADLIVSTLHVHLDHDNCLEVLVVRGEAARVRELANRLISTKGVYHGRLSVSVTNHDLHSHS